MSKKDWREVVALKRAERDAKIEKHARNTSNAVSGEHITDVVDIGELTTLLRERKVTAEQVMQAYIAKACRAQEKTNCLTEILFDDALTQAKELDVFLQETGQLKGPLHGVPMSLKDQFNVKGYDSTIGYVGHSFKPASSDALLVSILKQMGAIVLAKTNICQSIMWCETENPLWGLTTHPLNANLTPGGSTGGEGALLAMQGSMFGLGTDIGGSTRIPSHINGLWGLKPSSARLSYQGVEVSTEGQLHVLSAVGAMARSLGTLTTVTKALIETQLWTMDAALPPIPWKQDVFDIYSQKKLVIGVIRDDGVVRPHPPISRVLEELVSKLQASGHEVISWDSKLHAECIAVMDQFYTADGGEDIRRAVEAGGEPFIPHVENLVTRAPAISVYEYWQLNKTKIALQQAYLQMWNSVRSPSGRPVDVLLTPVMPHPAVPHRACRWVGYTKIWNFLDYTALVFPAGKISTELDAAVPPPHEARNTTDSWNWNLFDVDAMNGLSIGLQIVGRKLEEEKVLGVAAQIQDLVRST